MTASVTPQHHPHLCLSPQLCHRAVTMRYNPVMDGYLTLRQATEELGLKDPSGLRHAVRRGQLRTERVGHLHVTTHAWLEAYAAHVRAHRGGRGTPKEPRGAGSGRGVEGTNAGATGHPAATDARTGPRTGEVSP